MLVNVDKLVNTLHESSYDEEEVAFLQEGFTRGFDIRYEGPLERQSEARNLPLHIGSQTELWNKLMDEVEVGRVAGPFDVILFDNYIKSPIGLVPKLGSNKT